MDRKDFLRKGLVGTGMFISAAAMGKVIENNIDELKPLDPIGFNHLPNFKEDSKENSVLHKAGTRGHANHGWLDTHHSFSFANYYNPDRMHFGVLRVLNDDVVDAGRGFPRHPHDNMEIISIPLEGDLEHTDSMNNVAIIKHNDIQVMSAGKGIHHSEYNRNTDRLTRFLQIWVFPNTNNVKPRYDQITLNPEDRHNKLQQILSPSPDDAGVWIHQDAWFHLGKFDKNFVANYTLKQEGNGIYAFVIKGDFTIDGQALNERDGYGLWDINAISITADSSDSELLLMEVPMSI